VALSSIDIGLWSLGDKAIQHQAAERLERRKRMTKPGIVT